MSWRSSLLLLLFLPAISRAQLTEQGHTSIYRRSYTTSYFWNGIRIAPDLPGKRDAVVSPDGRTVAFAAGNNLYVWSSPDSLTAVTTDGVPNQIINGTTDWVYEEELEFTRAFAFSPDGRRLAYLRFDERAVPVYVMPRYDAPAESFKYPRAGEPNSTVTMHVYDLTTGATTQVAAADYLLAPAWTPEGELIVQRMDRAQKNFFVEIGGREIYSIHSDRYVDLKGWHLDLRKKEFVVRDEVPTGQWRCYRVAYRDGRIRPTVCKEEEKQPVDPAGRVYFTWLTERGDTLRAWKILPPDFDQTKKYPVLLTQYSGPGSQQVADWARVDWESSLAEKGYIVACTDGRGTGGRGEAFKKQTYGQLGRLETEDQLSFGRYMAGLEYVDPARVGIYGWSFGGFMALNCAFTAGNPFRMVIAVAPVASWNYYDSIYTERYNGVPAQPGGLSDQYAPLGRVDGFDDSRVKLLIIHGTADDNVHFFNTMQVAAALNERRKLYDMMVYPDQNHGMRPDDGEQVRAKMVAYVLRNL